MADFSTLPDELQVAILERCHQSALAAVCCTSRAMDCKARPILWRDIAFEGEAGHVYENTGQQWLFLTTCDRMAKESPDTFASLASLVHSLHLTPVPGPWITLDGDSYVPRGGPPTKVFDLVARFPNLAALSVYVRQCLDWDPELLTQPKVLPKLRDVKVGGTIPPGTLRALLARPEQLHRVSFLNLFETPGQRRGPDPVLFLGPIEQRFTNLSYLHLSKFAELHPDHSYAGLRWDWDVEQERAQLAEWSGLLDHVNSTLRELILENCYHCCEGNSWWQDAAGDDPDDFLRTCGAGSSDHCREILYPIIRKHLWPLLRHVTMMGIHQVGEAADDPFSAMQGRVTVEYRPGTIVPFVDDATPIDIDPPYGYFS